MRSLALSSPPSKPAADSAIAPTSIRRLVRALRSRSLRRAMRSFSRALSWACLSCRDLICSSRLFTIETAPYMVCIIRMVI